jgi:Mg2+ and Co2+ transporter CorA
MVSETLGQALPAAKRLTTAPHDAAAKDEAFADISADFDRILSALNELQGRVDRLTAIVTSEISIEDSRRGLEENHNRARLTWLATTFIPLTFVSGLFSMNEDITQLEATYGWYFAAALPFTMLVLAIGFLVGGGALGIKASDKGTKKRGVDWREKLKLK